MKKFSMLITAAAMVLMLAGCGDKDIKTVKNGVLGIDKSRTVEQALSANLEDLKWEKFVNKKNQTMVKVSGVWKSDGLAFDGGFTIVKPGKQVEAYFIINRDGSFSFADGKVTSATNDLGYVGFGGKNIVEPYNLRNLEGGFLGVLYH